MRKVKVQHHALTSNLIYLTLYCLYLVHFISFLVTLPPTALNFRVFTCFISVG